MIVQQSSSPLFWWQEAQPQLLYAFGKNFLVLRSQASISSDSPFLLLTKLGHRCKKQQSCL
ncbi:MAG: hypothetical protein RMY64_19065 [Nostoc sp. DedQUE08]|uniref:hypothetical protein n=1 Tax=unclassified Nostoc TaxID=2593658 RepID=UPI002AD2BB4C|nr:MULTISPECIES: hypothetical protein [unclassified Nostoc]MDZ8032256.1 hypothetical protein [Nostoc sp. DedSLP04]MDZ8067691.1 hypothetical protein [Nostoc sp. DedQUE08]